MAISFVKAVALTTTSAGTTLTGTPANTAGNLLAIVIYSRSATIQPSVSSVSDTGGNTWARAGAEQQQSAQHNYTVWYSVTSAISGTLTITTNNAGNSNVCQALELHSPAGWPSTPVDVVKLASASTGTALASGTSAATVQGSEVAIGFGAQGPTATFSAQTAGYTVQTQIVSAISGENVHLQTAYKILSATGTQSYGLTSSNSAIWGCGVVTFADNASGGGISASISGSGAVGATFVATVNIGAVIAAAGALAGTDTARAPLVAAVAGSGTVSGTGVLLTNIAGSIAATGAVSGTTLSPTSLSGVITGVGSVAAVNTQAIALIGEVDGVGLVSGTGTFPATSNLVASIDGVGGVAGTLTQIISAPFAVVQAVTSCDGSLELGSASGILGLTSVDGRLLLRDQE